MTLTIAGVEITDDILNLLSDEEQHAIESLTCNLSTKAHRQSIDEYNLVYTTHCVVCGHSTRQLFRMVQQGALLTSKEVAQFEEGEQFRISHKDFYSCPWCFNFFMQKSKEELVNIILRRGGK